MTASGTPGAVTESLGLANEAVQWATEWGDDYRSGFSPEDMPSNSAGADFGEFFRSGNSSVDCVFHVMPGQDFTPCREMPARHGVKRWPGMA